MCGIAGFICFDGSLGEQDLHVLNNIQAHRGPNGQGVFHENGFGLAHTRLSIQDLSEHSSQPFFSHCKRYVASFNGEIYNFKELAKEVEPLHTSSDTEVLVELFAKDGISFLDKIRGMFALAIYDRQERKLWLIRDRLGIKPLYYYFKNGVFAFASELKAIKGLAPIGQNLSIDYEAQNHFLHVGFVPEPYSIYQEIRKFPSAHWACLSEATTPNPVRYWQINYEQNSRLSYHEAKEEIQRLIVSSVKEHLISDTPVGLFLSGGTDSSLLAAIAQRHLSAPVKTFSIGFKGSKHNEAPYAKRIAEYLKTDHTEYILDKEEALEIMSEVTKTYDEPFADSSAIPTMLISKLASQSVKVALSGEGADELFLGYGTYTWASRLQQPLVSKHKKTLRRLAQLFPTQKGQKAFSMLAPIPKTFLAAHIFSQEHGFFSPKEVYDMPLQKLCYHGLGQTKLSNDLITNQNIFDFEVALKDNLLVKLDRASMRYGLEARVPFLDHRLVELAVSLPTSFKTNHGEQKVILKDILFDYLPKVFFDRPKWGFGLELSTLSRGKDFNEKLYAKSLLNTFGKS
jgi:asparagine synthase (glutamine-hydrolysing)